MQSTAAWDASKATGDAPVLTDTDPASPMHYTPSGAKFNDDLIRKLAAPLECEGDDYF